VISEMTHFRLTEQEKQKAKDLLEELSETVPEGLPDWNIGAQTLLVFIAMRHAELFFEVNR